MQNARLIGNTIERLCKEKNIDIEILKSVLNCSDYQVYSLFKGLVYASFDQLIEIAKALGVTIEELLNGNKEEYRRTVVHCINDFQDDANCEFILDLIEDYIDIKNAVEVQGGLDNEVIQNY